MVPNFVGHLSNGGQSPALIFPGRAVITYDQLAQRVATLATSFGGEKRLIAIEASLSEHAIIAYLAALAGGHAVALLPPGDTRAAASFQKLYGPDICFRKIGDRWLTDHTAHPSCETLHPDLTLLLSTSGSTGQGKFVRLSGRNVEANADSIVHILHLTCNDRSALILPLHYSYGLSVLNSHLAAHASVFVPRKSILDTGFVEDLRESRCTNISGVPYSFELFEQIGFRQENLPNLRMLTVAGGRLPADLVRLYGSHLSRQGKELFVMYGQTEATARMAYVPPHLVVENPHGIGIAIPGGELGLADEYGMVIHGAETPGELIYSGPNIMMGYASSRSDLSRGAELTELKTGDLAIRDKRGFYRIVGRRSRVSKIAGLRIGHDLLEQALSLQGIQAAVLGDDQSIIAFYTSSHSEDTVRNALVQASGLTALHVEASRQGILPRLPSGKVDYQQLRMRFGQKQTRKTLSVRTAFREAFFPLTVADNDTFVSLGGDSLRYVRLSLELERVLHQLPENWENRSIAELSTMGQAKTGMQTVGTDLLIRTLAILCVVVQHATLWPIPGGAAAMVMLIGYGLARFQSGNLFSGNLTAFARPIITVLAPYYLIVAVYGLAWGKVPWTSVLLVGNFGFADPANGTMVPLLYWFVEAYVQMMLIWIGLFAIPTIRNTAARSPYSFGMSFLAAALAIRFMGPLAWPIGDRQIFTVPWVLYLAAFGWLAYFADNFFRKLLVLAAAAAIFPLVAYSGGNWIGSWVKYMLQFALLAALLSAPRVSLPRRIVRLVLPISAASYHIYLFHRFVPELILTPLEGMLPWSIFTAASIFGGVAAGLLANEFLKNLLRWAWMIKPFRLPWASQWLNPTSPR